MFEFKVFSSGIDVAKEGNATQSSTLKHFNAERAIDGDPRSFSHTKFGEDSWFKVDLAKLLEVESVKIDNRYCGDSSDSPECLCRLSDANISLIDSNGNMISSQALGNTCGMKDVIVDFESGC